MVLVDTWLQRIATQQINNYICLLTEESISKEVFSDPFEDVMWHFPGKSKKTKKNIFHNKHFVETSVRIRCLPKRNTTVTCSAVKYILSTEFTLSGKRRYSHRCA